MNNSLSASQQVLIKKSGRTIERLASNSDVFHLMCFLFEVASIICYYITEKPFTSK